MSLLDPPGANEHKQRFSRDTTPAVRLNAAMNAQPLAGKTGVVFGVANKRSIAWAIAQAWSQAGAHLTLSYQGERLKESVQELAATLTPPAQIAPCDVTRDEEIRAFFDLFRTRESSLDLLLHSIAYAPKEAMSGDFLSTSRQAYLLAHEISAYSLLALVREAAPLLSHGASILALSFYGSQKVFPRYNVMGVAKASLEATVRYLAYDLGERAVRVNAISAGPVITLAARGISGFGEILDVYSKRAPLGRSCELSEIAQTALFLAGEGASAITGQTIYVDGGYEIMGV